VRILFVGLDHGKDTESYDARDSRKWFLETYRGPSRKGWRFGGNKHLFGCVQVAAEILNLDCRSRCEEMCDMMPERECVLCNFAKGNAVRCVESSGEYMKFQSENRVSRCLPFLFEQLELLLPGVIVLQGRTKAGHIQEDFKQVLNEGNWGHLEMTESKIVGSITWRRFGSDRGPVAIAFFVHPSARGLHSFKIKWETEILPATKRIRSILRYREAG